MKPLALLILAGSLLVASTARAEEGTLQKCSGIWCVQPAGALAWVVNCKTGDVDNAAVLLGVSLTRNGGIPLGAGIYGGSVVGPSGAHPQLAALFSIWHLGALGPGILMQKDPTSGNAYFQFLVDVSLNLDTGGTPNAKAASTGVAK